MANLSLLLIFVIFLKISYCRILDGLYLNPEFLKTNIEIRSGNDYMDYNPDHRHVIRDYAVIEVPGTAEFIEVKEARIQIIKDKREASMRL